MNANGEANGGVDSAALDELIPQIFDQMRTNQLDGSGAAAWGTAAVSTATLLKEMEQLDQIIPVLQQLNESLRRSTGENLSRIRRTCEAVNRVLDTWIKIQSQAGYVGELMDDSEYLSYMEKTRGDEGQQQAYMESLRKQVEELRRKVDERRAVEAAAAAPRAPERTRGASGIPRGGSRITKRGGTTVRGRRMFR
ncbi:AAR161Wp [Eremothecium gossypii ATCC 10895]|uniref:DASH complex subunit DUO1 n=1 Tax=Eremothecium gossypii (strain ATCC 10895 / CBS 109.51 / FGSC 9923 / NRRL Y-1056) TaxID=284811 RepID=DUO1_EREGS|nr:AAR161Wp [Eremothecium gossypii ATCC 10895]Q75ED7.2 RecName: Full=DASH complex subunit DUO1; AltName: Full=Outer kinetochore protein DUO1 [Eremothecium gossypii ATCC 10895]AAS50528.2 AAR161Wp [Eremothecium gossypii ATCC 10895]AEY94815.1 FAAR161Wp [Eremothecium gossypii FDAG1]